MFSFFILSSCHYLFFIFFFFNDTATTEIYTLSLHDALPISFVSTYASALNFVCGVIEPGFTITCPRSMSFRSTPLNSSRSEEHTSELQSQSNLVCRLLLEKKKKKIL